MLPENLSSLRVVDLRNELTKRGQSSKGKKDELVARLQQFLENESSAPEAETTNVPTTTDATTDTNPANASDHQAISKAAPDDATLAHVTPTHDTSANAPPANATPATTSADVATNHSAAANTAPTDTRSENATPANDTRAHPVETPEAVTAPEDEKDAVSTTTFVAQNDTAASVGSMETQPPTPAVPDSQVDESTTNADEAERGQKRKRDGDADGDAVVAEKAVPKRTRSDAESNAEPSQDTATAPATSAPEADKSTDASDEEITSPAIYIRGFVRPLVVRAVKDLLAPYGELQRFWMDTIKTHCYAVFETTEQAKAARQGIHGKVFPQETGNVVEVFGLTPEQVELLITQEQEAQRTTPKYDWQAAIDAVRRGESLTSVHIGGRQPTRTAATGMFRQLTRYITRDAEGTPTITAVATEEQAPAGRNASGAAQPTPAGSSLDDLFRKTTTLPHLYYLPVSDAVAKERLGKM